MSKVLSTAKQILSTQANELYELRKEGLEGLFDYENHYKNLGAMIFQIDSYNFLGDLLNDMENDNLTELGYFGADQDLLESFIKILYRSL